MSLGEADMPRYAPPRFTTATEASPSADDPDRDDTSVMIPQPETRPISQDQLVAEVKAIFAGLVAVETKCIEFDNAQSSRTNIPKLNNDQWQALVGLHRTLLHEHPKLLHEYSTLPHKHFTCRHQHDDFFSAPSVLHSPFHHIKVQRHTSKYVLHTTRAWRRLNDRLLPLLRREQDVESSQQWSAVRELSSSLLNILNKDESAFEHLEIELQTTLNQIEAILARLLARFRNKYHELSR